MIFPTIGFAGLTHLGIVSQTAAAAQGFPTVGFDPNENVISRLSNSELPITEPDLAELFRESFARMAFCIDQALLSACDLVYVSVDVPTNDVGESDLTPVVAMVKAVVPAMKAGATLVILCQVPPGFTRRLPLPAGQVFYQVETLILGSAVERAMHPERIIVGCSDPNAPLPWSLSTYLSTFRCPILPMRYESAELTKISINMYLAASVCVANVMANLCENTMADWDEVVPALKLDRRIGHFAYLRPGLGLSGGNLERDLSTVMKLADQTGSNASTVRSWLSDSAFRKDWVLRQLHRIFSHFGGSGRLAILGLAYKENTASTKNSASLSLLSNIAPSGRHHIAIYDPVVRLIDALATSVVEAESAYSACMGAQVVLVMTPWPEFKELDLCQIRALMGDEGDSRWLIDPYRVFDPAESKKAKLRHIVLGRPVDQETSSI